jgi:hypothetical protein
MSTTTIVAAFPTSSTVKLSTGGLSSSSSSSSSNTMCISCPSTTLVFLQALTTKLIDMTNSLKLQFENLAALANSNKARGTIIASMTVKGAIKFKREYAIYLQRFGPPLLGEFDPLYLELIRAELKAGIIL